MYVARLELHQFRNYSEVELRLDPGVTIFQGSNGQGKTNLVEAIEYLSRLGSHRVSNDTPLVKAGTEQAVIRAEVVAGTDDPRRLLLELEINPGRANRARINRGALPRTRDLLGALRTVVFSPEDLSVVKGDPAARRNFLDDLVISRWPRMLGVKQDYEKVVKQRNSLLKSLAQGHGDADAEFTLDIWDQQLVSYGSELLAARLDTLSELTGPTSRAYAQIAPLNNQADASYRAGFALPGDPAELPGAFAAALADRRREERSRGLTLVGPHRDDLYLTIGELPAKGYASHGESWSLALALRLGAFELLRSDGIEAVLILDDVFAELDATRRDRLAKAARDAEQVLVTAAVASDVPGELRGERFNISAGQLIDVGPSDASPVEGDDRAGDDRAGDEAVTSHDGSVADGPEPSTEAFTAGDEERPDHA
ncbi:DNA replication/repair protein RecF [Propionimicrobium sp. PCR01-08-3]|uniref:DNA replication/repair protein RecF n=1 Tax=Propionimicrobium sp. PCR01-08-3 TaxID=3052086 RepID=UPI00255CDAAE|nr:DNA replication/repair protein RecF [Propionimicrobium sp. PCR01-08-3]WIY82593.1 DNA replication/repair protein RecF [Propionimicrobium sp. PCR01-08-3]